MIYWNTQKHEWTSKCLWWIKEGSKKSIQTLRFDWNKLLGNANEFMRQNNISGFPEDRWEEWREGRRLDIMEIHDLDGCGNSFMGIYTYDRTSQIVYFSYMNLIVCHLHLNKSECFERNITKSSMAMLFLYWIPSIGFLNQTENQTSKYNG